MFRFIRSVLALLILAAALPANAATQGARDHGRLGRARRPSSAATRSTCTSRPARCRTCIASMRSRAWSRARARADLVVATGAELEIGWLPVLIQESGNSRIQPGSPGYFEAASVLQLLEKPRALRSLARRHPSAGQSARAARSAQHRARREGADASASRSSTARTPQYYQQRAKDFETRWNAAIQRWESKAAPLKGAPVVVMHSDQAYLCHWLGLQQLAAIEPKPGMPPTAGYLGQLVTKLKASPPKRDPA